MMIQLLSSSNSRHRERRGACDRIWSLDGHQGIRVFLQAHLSVPLGLGQWIGLG